MRTTLLLLFLAFSLILMPSGAAASKRPTRKKPAVDPELPAEVISGVVQVGRPANASNPPEPPPIRPPSPIPISSDDEKGEGTRTEPNEEVPPSHSDGEPELDELEDDAEPSTPRKGVKKRARFAVVEEPDVDTEDDLDLPSGFMVPLHELTPRSLVWKHISLNHSPPMNMLFKSNLEQTKISKPVRGKKKLKEEDAPDDLTLDIHQNYLFDSTRRRKFHFDQIQRITCLVRRVSSFDLQRTRSNALA
jgi:hypothetical protein